MHRYKDLTGMRFGMLVVTSLHSIANGKSKWNCICDCGNVSSPFAHGLKSGKTASCGCLANSMLLKMSKSHGMTHTAIYSCWLNMKQRCTNPKGRQYHNYGGRGIKICDRWLNSFENFYADMGDAPDGYELDRIDNNLGYSKENCRWATPKEQVRNRRKTIWIDGLRLPDIAEVTGIHYRALYAYYRRNKTLKPEVIAAARASIEGMSV